MKKFRLMINTGRVLDLVNMMIKMDLGRMILELMYRKGLGEE